MPAIVSIETLLAGKATLLQAMKRRGSHRADN
jgi:hypothetical protein